MHRGYIKLWRKIEDWDLYFSEPFTKAHAWIDLLMMANHKGKSFSVRGNIIKIVRGQIARSETTLATRWQWSRKKVHGFLNMLKSRQQIFIKNSTILSVITIYNYEIYQPEDTTEEHQKSIRSTQTRMIKNEKNENTPPTPPEIFSLGEPDGERKEREAEAALRLGREQSTSPKSLGSILADPRWRSRASPGR